MISGILCENMLLIALQYSSEIKQCKVPDLSQMNSQIAGISTAYSVRPEHPVRDYLRQTVSEESQV